MKLAYVEKPLRKKTLELAARINERLAEAAAAVVPRGPLAPTPRQLYYLLLAAGDITAGYSNLGATINDLRLAGLLDWSALTECDAATWTQAAARPLQLEQVGIEVWINKPAVAKSLDFLAVSLGVRFVGWRSFPSQLFLRDTGDRLVYAADATGVRQRLLCFSDLSAAGRAAAADLRTRLITFVGKRYTSLMEIVPCGLNAADVREHRPAGSRANGYELEALPPHVLVNNIVKAVKSLRSK